MKGIASAALAVLLIAQSILAQQPATNPPVKQSIAALPPGARVDLQLLDGTSLRGRIASRAESDFTLKQDGRDSAQTILYQQVRFVSQVKGKHSKAKWIVIGVVAGAAVVIAIIGVHIAHHPLGSGPI